MKNTLLTILIVILIFNTACEENEQKELITSELDGKWSLIYYSPGFGPLELFNTNDVIWTIQNSTLSVNINIELDESSRIPFKETSTHQMTIKDYPTYSEIIVEDENFPYFNMDSVLIIDKGSASDGIRIEFEKLD